MLKCKKAKRNLNMLSKKMQVEEQIRAAEAVAEVAEP